MAESFFADEAAFAGVTFFIVLAEEAFAAGFFAVFAAGFFMAFAALFAAVLVDFLVGRAAAEALAAVVFLAGARGEIASTPCRFT